jgi:hypothetical protein
MAVVIHVDFKNKKGNSVIPLSSYTLKEARKFLGSGYFRKALFEWSLTQLRMTANHPEAYLTDAADAYEAILKFRLQRKLGQTPLRLIKTG